MYPSSLSPAPRPPPPAPVRTSTRRPAWTDTPGDGDDCRGGLADLWLRWHRRVKLWPAGAVAGVKVEGWHVLAPDEMGGVMEELL